MRLLLAREPRAELRAAEAVDAVCAGLGFSRDTLDEIKLAVVEACLNALEYGNGGVEVELASHAGSRPWVEVRVTDHGPGFDPARVPKPRLARSLHDRRKRGWGLELIRCLMDRVEISSQPGETLIRMVRGRGGA